MNKKNINKGFTLIELLVVIAIVGILSGLIIVSLGDATNQAKEAKIKSALDQLRPVAQLHFNTNGSYTNLLTDPKVVNIFDDMKDNSVRYDSDGGGVGSGTAQSATAIANLMNVKSGGAAWCAYAITPNNSCMCVDNTGAVVENNGATTYINACSCVTAGSTPTYLCP
ncbi:MAG: type II secretion system protein [Candidatus Pacebacteria bacterium]|nr:type II secretion system protein [Candidatus Paceibacterota bacterium]